MCCLIFHLYPSEYRKAKVDGEKAKLKAQIGKTGEKKNVLNLVNIPLPSCSWMQPHYNILSDLKQFILYQALLKSTTGTPAKERSLGRMARSGDNGIFSTLQLALTCWVVNRLQAIILSIQDGVHAEKSSGGNADGINPPGAYFSLMEQSDSNSTE